MAKNLEFTEYVGSANDADGDPQETTVRACIIGADEVYITDQNTGNRVRREVMTPTGARQVSEGDVFVETDRPGVYDYLTGEAWGSTGYADVADSAQESGSKRTRKAAASNGDS